MQLVLFILFTTFAFEGYYRLAALILMLLFVFGLREMFIDSVRTYVWEQKSH